MTRSRVLVVLVFLIIPISVHADQCCIGKPYPGLPPPEEMYCYEGARTYDLDGRMVGCLWDDNGNCEHCEAVITVIANGHQ